MKKNNIDLDSRFWSGRSTPSPVSVLELFFEFHDLATAKERLNLIVQYAVQGENADPRRIFGGLSLPPVAAVADPGRVVPPEEIREMDGGETVPETGNPLMYGALSEEEYRDPVLVFRKAFKEYRPEELEDFLSDIVYFSLGAFHNVPERDIVGPYLHLMKMLDAAWLIVERKNRKKDRFQSAPQEIEVQIR